MHEERPRLSGNKLAAYNHITKQERRILVIGDLHAPFELDGYFDFCKETYKNYNCNQVIFIGDIIDNHYSSFHTTDPDAWGAVMNFLTQLMTFKNGPLSFLWQMYLLETMTGS